MLFRQCGVSLRHRPDPCFDRIPIIIKTLHHIFAVFSLYTNNAKARVGEQALQSVRVSQCEREMDYVPLGRKEPLTASARIPHIGALSGVEMTHTATLPPLRR